MFAFNACSFRRLVCALSAPLKRAVSVFWVFPLFWALPLCSYLRVRRASMRSARWLGGLPPLCCRGDPLPPPLSLALQCSAAVGCLSGSVCLGSGSAIDCSSLAGWLEPLPQLAASHYGLCISRGSTWRRQRGHRERPHSDKGSRARLGAPGKSAFAPPASLRDLRRPGGGAGTGG